MNIGRFKGFAVIFSGGKKLQGAVFRKRKTDYELVKSCTVSIQEEDRSEAWKNLFRDLSVSRDEPLILAAVPDKGFFFRTEMAQLPLKAIKNALYMELPRRMILSDTENMLMEFALPASSAKTPSAGDPADTRENADDGMMTVNAFTFPTSSLEPFTEILVKCGRKADAFLYPFLALQQDDPPLYLKDTEENYYFADNSWHVAASSSENDPAGTKKEWEKIFRSTFHLPAGFDTEEFASLLLCARFAVTPQFHASETGLNILPAKLQPSRLKSQLKLCAVLIFIILANLIWNCSGKWIANAGEYRVLSEEKAALQEENRKLKVKIRRMEKEGKEKYRSSLLKTGEHDIVKKLNDLTEFLPSNVMISSMRWNDSGLDLTMFSEANSGISEIFRTKFPYWKLANIQQRNFGGAATMITVKLTNADENENKEGRR